MAGWSNKTNCLTLLFCTGALAAWFESWNFLRMYSVLIVSKAAELSPEIVLIICYVRGVILLYGISFYIRREWEVPYWPSSPKPIPQPHSNVNKQTRPPSWQQLCSVAVRIWYVQKKVPASNLTVEQMKRTENAVLFVYQPTVTLH